VCKQNTHTFSKIDIEKLFVNREIELGKKANPGAATKFYDNYNIKGWMNEGKPIVDLTSLVERWINTDDEKRKKPMIVRIGEKYKNKPESINDF
jgi:hypothetical protein